MKSIVALRSYGDYVVLLSSIITSSSLHNYKIYASEHLKKLHEAIFKNNKIELDIEFIDFGIKFGIFPLFTNKHFFSKGSFKALGQLKLFLNNKFIKETIFLEQKKRSFFVNVFTGNKINYIHSGSSNIYTSYFNFFNGEQKTDTLFSRERINNKKILLFPDSRKKEKELPKELITKIKNGINNKNIEIAKFGKNSSLKNNEGFVYYNNFSQLALLIQNSDFIISSDSLPLHMAYYFNTPHWVIYNNKVNTEWLTPYCMEHNTYSLFNNLDILLNYVNADLC